MTARLATRLVEPDYWTCPHGKRQRPRKVQTFGPEVAEVNAAAGFAPDPQQELLLDLTFAIRPDGSPESFETCVICCRQNLKTGGLKQITIGWLFVTEQRLVVWSAHEMSTTMEAQRELGELILGCPALSKFLPKQRNHGIYADNGSERIELTTGQRIMFKARTQSGGRGLAAPKLILDEAFALKASMMGSLLPLMTAQVDPQVVYASSAGKADSEALFDIRERGRLHMTKRMSYVEWLAPYEPCADPDCTHPKNALDRGIDCALDREHLLRAANPTLTTGRINLETLRDLRQALPPAEFMRESLGWWDEPSASSVFGFGAWDAAAVEQAPDPFPPIVALGVGVSLDGEWGSLAVARDHAGRVLLGVGDRQPNTAYLPAKAKRIQDLLRVPVVVTKSCPDPNLIETLTDAGVDVTVLDDEQWAQTCTDLRDAVRNRSAAHAHDLELDEAVAAASWRMVGEKGRRGFGRKSSTGDISMLDAAAAAYRGATEDLAYDVEDSLL